MATKTINVVPILPEAGWAQIHMKELYKGPVEENPPEDIDNKRKVPREGWWIVSEEGFYKVTRVNQNNISEYVRFNPFTGDEYENIITGPTVHQWTTPFKIYVDKSKVPIRQRVDDAMLFYGTEHAYYKIFIGTNIGPSGRVISTAVNGSGVPTNANLPLETVVGPNSENIAVKVCKGGHLLELPPNQQMCTVVSYAADGRPLFYRFAIIVYSDNVAPLDQSKRTIISISLESPYLSPDDKKLLEYPLNMRVESSGIMGVVQYNDGSIHKHPINGNKFSLHGHKNFVATVPGPTFDLGLTYSLSDDETAWNALGNVPQRSINEVYRIRAIAADGNYSVKIYPIPYWDSAAGMYKLRYYLYNMKRDLVQDITQYIEVTPGFVFDGKMYGTKQTMQVAINMSKVGPAFIDYRHPQVFSITLVSPASVANQTTYYTLEFSDETRYGVGVRADASRDLAVVGQSHLNISLGAANLDEWLNKTYRAVEPLYYTQGEDLPPSPTHVTVRDLNSTWTRLVDIDDVLNPITGIGKLFKQGDHVLVEFSAATAEAKLELAVCSMIVNIVQ